MEKAVLAGEKVEPTTPLMVIADLSVVWVQAEFYEEDAPLVRVGEAARVTVNSYPQRSWAATIDYLFPSVDAQTRTLRARLRIANPDLLLRPGMYANVEIRKALGYQLAVPEEAVLDSGTRQIVFLDRGGGYFEPREVKAGERTNGRREILSGLAAGERVVISGNFLIDSESRLKSALEGMEAMPGMPGVEHGRKATGETQPAAAPGAAPKGTEKKGMPGMPGM